MKRSTKAERWFDEGMRHYEAGDPQKALAAWEEAEALYRALIDDNQNQYRPNLAHTRVNEGVALCDLQRPADALVHHEEAAEIYRALIAAGQTQYRPNLAHTRMNEGNALSDLSHPEEAHARYAEAAAIYQALIAAGQPQYRPNLARTRMNEGNALCDLQRPMDALARYAEAAEIYRALIAAGQPQYRPDLARTWVNEGTALSDLNRPEGARARYEEATEVIRALIAAGQTQYRPSWANAQMAAGNAFLKLNHPDEALVRYREAAGLYQTLIDEGQTHYRLNLVKTLVNAALGCADRADRLETTIIHLNHVLAVWEDAEAMPAVALDTAPHLAKLIGRTRSVAGFSARVERLTQQIARTLGGVAPENLGQFYPLAEQTFTRLLNAALDQKQWDLALTVIGTARAQRLAKLAQADLLRCAAREDDPAALREYREAIRQFAELEILLNTETGASGEGTTSGRGGGENTGQQYQTLYNEYTTLRGKLGKLEQTLRQQNLLPDLGAGLFDGAGLRQKLPPTAALLLLVEVGESSVHFVVVLTRDGGQVLAMEGGSDWVERLDKITSAAKRKGRTLRDGPGCDTRTASAEANARAAPLEPADAQTEALTETLTEQFWQPIQRVVGDGVNTVWLLPTGDLHGLPWQASAPPGWRCRLAPAPWFVRQALDAPAAASLCPTAAAPLGVLAYAAPDSDKELLHMALEERGMRAIWEDAAHALAGLDRAPAPPPAHLVIAGHGTSDAAIPGAARIWVGHEGAEPRYVGFGDLWNAPLSPFLLLLYFSSCVVGRTREVNGEPLGLISAGDLVASVKVV